MDSHDLLKRSLRAQMARVPREQVTIYNWHSEEGRQFWDSVQLVATEGQVDLDTVGMWVGLTNLRQRLAQHNRRAG